MDAGESPRVIAVIGATATGKSEFALDLAERLTASGIGVEIVNTDAMQLYRGMDIGTAKLAVAERRGIPHHQIDVLDPLEGASVAAFQEAARADIAAIHAAGSIALCVGGSGLYVRALLDELEFPGTDPALRAALTSRAEAEGGRVLHDELAQRDPEAAARIEPANVRRVVRALEVIELTGRPFSASLPEGIHHYPGTIQLGLAAEGSVLDERIAQRTDAMIRAGLVDEVAGLELGRTASRATGYAEALAVLRGDLPAAELADAISLATRQLARRQIKWFRRDARTHWVRADDAAARDRAQRDILATFG